MVPRPHPRTRVRALLTLSLVGALALVVPPSVPAAGPPQELDAHQARAREILAELVELRTSAERPDETRRAMEAMAARLRDAGFPPEDVEVVEPEAALSGLVAHYRGSGGAAPVLLMAHVDVVDADPDAWSFEPFELGERDGYYWGRGTVDNKAGVATLVANFMRLREEGFVPDRDLIMLLTGDEETDGKVIDWMVGREDVRAAAYALNTDAGGGAYDPNGEPMAFHVQTSEKMYQTFRLTATNPGGHSSVPRPDNAIYRLAAALGRLAEHRFPVRRNEGTRLMFQRSAELRPGELGEAMRAFAAGGETDPEAAERLAAASPSLNALLRTTCVATMLEAGVAENALPRSATATVNCRIFPGVSADEVEGVLRDVVADDRIRFERVEGSWAVLAPPSELPQEILAALEELVQERWPGTPVIPNMSTGATDGLFVRKAGVPVYGVSAIFDDPDDVRAHGLDERIGIAEFHAAHEFWYRMLRRLAGDTGA